MAETIDIVLVGGGHAHVQVLRAFGLRPDPRIRLILVAKEIQAPYSGMLPGLVAGRYEFEECHIDLARLAGFANARLVHGEAIGMDRVAKQLQLKDLPPIAYDILSIDVGITPDTTGIEGAENFAVAVKPISTFWPKWQKVSRDLLQTSASRNLTIIGGGAAGFELSIAAAYRPRKEMHIVGTTAEPISVTLVAGDKLLPTHSHHARRLAYEALKQRRVQLIEDDRAIRLTETKIELESGRTLPTDATLLTTGAAPPVWFKTLDLQKDRSGYLSVRPTLQSPDDDDIFAVGDCASVIGFPREKSGVFAVRQGPPLIENLRRHAAGKSTRPFRPQKYFMTILSLADGNAIAAKGPFAAMGKWAWRWKNWIDKRFMKKFQDLPEQNA